MILGYCGVDREHDDVALSLTPDKIIELYVSRHPECKKFPCTGGLPRIGWDAYTVFTGLYDTITGKPEIRAVIYEITDEFQPVDDVSIKLHGYVINGLAALRKDTGKL